MKKLNLSLAAIFAMGTFAVAGGDIAPVEPVVEEPVVVESTGAFYLGIGYGYFDQSMDNINNEGLDIEADTNNVLLQAGYQFNEYIAIEGRYWIGVGDATWSSNLSRFNVDLSGDYSSWGIYVKPMYPVTDSFNIYALLGYASTSLDADGENYKELYWDTDEFSWGIGAEFGVTDNVFIFADYVNLGYPDDVTWDPTGENFDVDGDLYTFNVGVTYKF
jgi:opacity protein-like surface antigen